MNIKINRKDDKGNFKVQSPCANRTCKGWVMLAAILLVVMRSGAGEMLILQQANLRYQWGALLNEKFIVKGANSTSYFVHNDVAITTVRNSRFTFKIVGVCTNIVPKGQALLQIRTECENKTVTGGIEYVMPKATREYNVEVGDNGHLYSVTTVDQTVSVENDEMMEDVVRDSIGLFLGFAVVYIPRTFDLSSWQQEYPMDIRNDYLNSITPHVLWSVAEIISDKSILFRGSINNKDDNAKVRHGSDYKNNVALQGDVNYQIESLFCIDSGYIVSGHSSGSSTANGRSYQFSISFDLKTKDNGVTSVRSAIESQEPLEIKNDSAAGSD